MPNITGSVGRSGQNRPEDVRLIQGLLNQNLRWLAPLAAVPVDGLALDGTVAAIEAFQRRVAGLANPDGRVDPGGRTLQTLITQAAAPPTSGMPEDFEDAPWIAIARAELGQLERPGRDQNPRILEFIASFPYLAAIPSATPGLKLSQEDETPWCACFVNWCLKKAGCKAGPSARAKDWLTYGEALDTPRFGCICVVHNSPNRAIAATTTSGFHVAFWTGSTGSAVTLLGGNQSNAVTETNFGWTILGYRWPPA